MNVYTNEELKLFNKLTDNLIIELFNTLDKRYAVDKIIREAYEKGKEAKKKWK